MRVHSRKHHGGGTGGIGGIGGIAERADRDYPEIYQACNNENGLHLVGNNSAWTVFGPTESMEVYVR